MTSLLIHLKDRMTCCANYHFNEIIFPLLGREKSVLEEQYEIILNVLTLTYISWSLY